MIFTMYIVEVMSNKEIGIAILGILKFASIVPFVIGIILSFDGFNILYHGGSYKSGLLKVDSLTSGSGGMELRGSTIRAYGNIDAVHTGIILDDNTRTKQILIAVSNDKIVYIPVWYRPDGELTLDRYSHEDQFPINRVQNKLIKTILFFNGPLVLIWILQFRLKRKKE